MFIWSCSNKQSLNKKSTRILWVRIDAHYATLVSPITVQVILQIYISFGNARFLIINASRVIWSWAFSAIGITMINIETCKSGLHLLVLLHIFVYLVWLVQFKKTGQKNYDWTSRWNCIYIYINIMSKKCFFYPYMQHLIQDVPYPVTAHPRIKNLKFWLYPHI